MSEWWTYSLSNFLLFAPRVYWRLFELHNAAVWPAHVLGLLLGLAILACVLRPRPWSGRVIAAGLAAAWVWVAWSFLWHRYATINWAMTYVAPVFVLEGALLLWIGGVQGRLQVARGTAASAVGLGLLLYALVLHPLTASLAGRPLQAAEVFAIAPDPTVIATLGILSMATGRVLWVMLLVPLAWSLVSWATLYAMAAPEGWIPLAAAGLAVLAWVGRPLLVRSGRVL